MLKIVSAVCNRNNITVLKVPDFSVPKSSIVILQGLNGSGKSTFLSSIFGVHETSLVGSVLFKELDVSKNSSLDKTNLGMYYVPQTMPKIDGVSLVKILYFSSKEKTQGQSILEYIKTIEEKVTNYGLDIKLLRSNIGSDVSGGQKKQMEMISVLAQDKEIFFLDEIDSGVDSETQDIFASVINSLKKEGKSFVIVTHNNGFKDKLNIDITYECTNNTIKRS